VTTHTEREEMGKKSASSKEVSLDEPCLPSTEYDDPEFPQSCWILKDPKILGVVCRWAENYEEVCCNFSPTRLIAGIAFGTDSNHISRSLACLLCPLIAILLIIIFILECAFWFIFVGIIGGALIILLAATIIFNVALCYIPSVIGWYYWYYLPNHENDEQDDNKDDGPGRDDGRLEYDD